MGVMNKVKMQKQKGFTIVELLIVIVGIGILAAITIVAYNGLQDRARTAQINADMENLDKATRAARLLSNGALRYVTLSAATGSACWAKPDGTDLAALPKTDGCWTSYLSALDKISTVSGVNVRNLVDPWGRPYYIDENEDEPAGTCRDDSMGTYSRPFTTGQTMSKLLNTRGC
jgi:prepilin-type N-terminal cleavage/methylation domain-containing protein